MLVVIVDGDAQAGAQLARLAEGAYPGANVILLLDGAQTLAVCTAWAVDLLIIDDNLPDMNGLGVASALRGCGRRMPILFIARPAVNPRAACRAGVTEVHAAPWRSPALLGAIQQLLAPASPSAG